MLLPTHKVQGKRADKLLRAHEQSEMHQITSNSDSITVCVLDDDPSQLEATNRVLSLAGCQTRPFTDPNTFLNYARTHSPDIAILDYGGPRARGLQIRARLREVSPATWTIIALKPHRNPAREMLPDKELVDLIKQYVATSPRQSFSKRPVAPNREVGVGCCA
jgi:PleD family two-component response regulator